MRFGSLFSGIGGFDLGFERSGLLCAWQVEIDKDCQKVLEARFQNVARFTDVKDVGQLPTVDVICGGFPCQDLSVAGKRAGLAGERSGLWFEFLRIIECNKPRWIVGLKKYFCATSVSKTSDNEHTAAALGHSLQSAPGSQPAIAFTSRGRDDGAEVETQEELSYALRDASGGASQGKVAGQFGVRRLTPRECEFLQGFPADWTLYDASGKEISDSARYRMLGNAVAAPVAEWIGRRIMKIGS